METNHRRLSASRSPKAAATMVTTSINDLPYDILYTIFCLCWDKMHPRTQLSFPTIASHVCRRWRDYALDTPTFWSSLNFEGYPLRLEKYQNWLGRSKDCPLDIALSGSPASRSAFKQRSIKTIKEILRLIVPCSNRWRTLKLSFVGGKVIRVVFDRLLDIPMPSLTKLEVMGGYYAPFHRPGHSKWRFRPFLRGGAPNIRSMVIDRLPCDYIDSRFTGLRVLEVCDAPSRDQMPSVVALKVHYLLSRLPQLHSLRIRFFGYYARYTDRNDAQTLGSYIAPPATHNSLEELSITARPSIRNAVIMSLVLPGVRYFVDYTRVVHEREIGLGICCLPVIGSTRPFPSLISLRLVGTSTQFDYSPSDSIDPGNSRNLRHLPGALASLPALRSLTLDRVDLEDEGYLNCLSKTCPELQWLSLAFCTGYTLVELRLIIERRKELRKSDSLVRLAVHGMVGWRTGSEQKAISWLTEEWNGDFIFAPKSSEDEAGKSC